jgi:hypothetical protein
MKEYAEHGIKETPSKYSATFKIEGTDIDDQKPGKDNSGGE